MAQKPKPLHSQWKRDFLQLSYGALKRVMSWRLAKNSYPSSTTFAKEYAKSIMQESLGAGLELLPFLLAVVECSIAATATHNTKVVFLGLVT